ncbi:insulysin [Acrasis kona]|uniref:Insulysin n=1 Tax=Acrasis kona TaxID=1008807 RepID=A0AAW2Z905_9EUKA
MKPFRPFNKLKYLNQLSVHSLSRFYTSKTKLLVDNDNFIKSKSDERKYRCVELNNGLQALLISDQSSTDSAASMDVHVGYMSDPKTTPGLAHFCEHMLFLGSKQHPEEGAYKKHLNKLGGSCNASTSAEHTNYYFGINNSDNGLDSTLDIFSCFFKNPLFSIDSTQREVNAVDSEFRRHTSLDDRRLSQILKHVSNKDHPFNNFSTGNKETLKVEDNVRDQMMSFYEKHYSPTNMKLAVAGKHDLDKLQSYVENRFNDVRSSEQEERQKPQHTLFTQNGSKVHLVVPVTNQRRMTLYWEIPSSYNNYKKNVVPLLSHLIEHKHAGGFYHTFKYEQKLINDVSFGTYFTGRWFTIIYLKFELSESASQSDVLLESLSTIRGEFFKYMEQIKNLNEDTMTQYFDEIKNMDLVNFDYLDKTNAVSYVKKLSKRMHHYPINELLSVGYKNHDYDPQHSKYIIGLINSNSCTTIVSNKNLKSDDTYETEPIYGTKYKTVQLEEGSHSVSHFSKYALPHENEYIPQDLSITQLHKDNNRLDRCPPNVHSSVKQIIYRKPFISYKAPYAYCFSHILLDRSLMLDPKSNLYLKIWLAMIREKLCVLSNMSAFAGCYFEVCSAIDGFSILMGGYNDKLNILNKQVRQKLFDINETDKDMFEKNKDDLLRAYRNMYKMQANDYANYLCNFVTTYPFVLFENVLPEVEKVTLSDVCSFVRKVEEGAWYVQNFANGNISDGIVMDVFHSNHKELSKDQVLDVKSVSIPKGVHIYECDAMNTDDNNSGVCVVFQVNSSRISCQLLSRMMKQPFFYQLRTQQQLGYVVSCSSSIRKDAINIRFNILSSAHDPRDVYLRITKFLDDFYQSLLTQDDATFQEFKDAIVNHLSKNYNNMWEESADYWQEICFEDEPQWDRNKQDADTIKNLSKSEVISLYEDTFFKNKKQLAVLVFGAKSDRSTCITDYSQTTDQATIIKDIQHFKSIIH